MEQRKRLAAMIRAHRFVTMPVCTNAFTARIIERLGFDAVYLGGNAFGCITCLTEPLHTMRTIQEMEWAGIAATHIEDRVPTTTGITGSTPSAWQIPPTRSAWRSRPVGTRIS